jgi:hypothetical protein
MTAGVDRSAEIQHPIGRSGRFTLHLPAGEVEIRGTDGEVATVRDTTGRPLGERFDIVTGADSLELTARAKFGFTIAIGSRSLGTGPTPNLVVEVPRGATVSVEGASADIKAVGIAGPKRFRTASGDLVLDGVSGDLQIDAVSGDARIEADGALDARVRSVSGDVWLRAPRLTRFEMTTTSGDMHIDAELSGNGPYSIKSISGDATIVARAGIQVEAQTITGDLSSNVAHRLDSAVGKKLLVVGRPAATLAFKSVSGDLEIVEPRDRAPVDEGRATVAADRPGAATGSPSGAAVSAGEAAHVTPAGEPSRAGSSQLEILEALERGEIDVETATQRLSALEGS